jgi:thiol-disulfide isomerase/thioredoxin
MVQFYIKIIIFSLWSYTVNAQDNSHILLSYNIHKNIKPYIREANAAYEKGDNDYGKMLFDSLIHNHLVGTQFDDFSFKRINKKRLHLNTIKKPIYLLTYSSWCIPAQGEISALNKLARKYEGTVQIVIVFWDREEQIKKMVANFITNIEVCYAHETYNKDALLISTLKHTLGVPVTFLIDEGMNIVDINRGGIHNGTKQPEETAIEMSYKRMYEEISPLLTNEITTKKTK